MGIEDPDPLVDRKGIKYLQEHGVTVTMFDRDLQEIIKAENKEFIQQALERAAAVEYETEAVTLSPLENPVAHADLKDFSGEALEQYRTVAGIKEAIGSEVFNRRLAQQGLLQLDGKKFVPSGFGLLLFGKSPRDVMPQAGLLGTIHHADGTEDKPRNFDGPQVLVPEQALKWLRDKLPDPIDRSEARRQEANRFFFALVREGIVNALVHRDYSIAGAKCQLIVTPDTIVIKSPGGPVEPITLDQLQSFNAPMLSRNPTLHYVFGKLELAEERGLGLKTMRESATQAGLPLPKYSWEAPYLVLTLYRSVTSVLKTLESKTLASLSKAERAGWQWLTTKQTVTSGEYAAAMDLPERTALNHLRRFTQLGLLLKVGSGRATEYHIHQALRK